jgi:hypothetical protein
MDRSDEEIPRVAAYVAPPRCVGARGTSCGRSCRSCGANTSQSGKECGRNLGRPVNRRHEQGGPLHIIEPGAEVAMASGQARVSHAPPRTSGPILRRTKDFVDQRQIKLHGVGDLPTIVAGRLHRLDACEGGRIDGGSAILEVEGLPRPPTLGFRCWLCGSDVLHLHSLPRCCTCLSLSYALHTPVAVRPCIMSSLVARHSTNRPSRDRTAQAEPMAAASPCPRTLLC